MIKQSIKNYFKCWKYIFTPLGVIALGVVLGLSVLIPATVGAVKELCGEIVKISDMAIDFDALWNSFTNAVRALDWNDAETALQTFFSKEWWWEVFEEDISNIISNAEEYFNAISNAVDNCIKTVFMYVIVLVAFTVIGFIAGVFLTRWLIRRDIAKRSIWKFILSAAADSVLSTLYIALTAWLFTVWSYSMYICVVVGFVLSAFASLINAYLVHGLHKVKFSKTVNIKNAAKLILSDLIIFAISAAFIAVVAFAINIIVGIFVGLGVITVTLSVIQMNAEAYVKSTAVNTDGGKAPDTQQTDYPIPLAETAAASEMPTNE